jgi:SAM-dependent methyltransferase
MTTTDNMTAWNTLHTQRRHALNYPAEPVVRFVQFAKVYANAATLLDVGCGSGRHMKLAAELGLEPSGIDASGEAIRQAAKYGPAEIGDMRNLPFPDNSFDCVVCYGTIYYGTKQDTRDTADEIRRVLVPGGHALINMRTIHDWRRDAGEEIAERTVRLAIEGEPEDWMVLNFADLPDLEWLSGLFELVDVNVLEETKKSMSRRESDWLIVARKPVPQ